MTHLDGGRHLLSPSRILFEHLLEILSPLSNRKLGDLHGSVVDLFEDTGDLVFVLLDTFNRALLSAPLNRSLTLKPRNQGSILSGSSPRINRFRLLTTSMGL